MIQSFREKLSGILVIAIIVIIAIPLAFFGVESLFLSSDRISNMGTVDGQDFTEDDFTRAVIAKQSQLQQMFGENYSPDLVDEETIKSAALGDLVDLNLYLAHAKRNDMAMTEALMSDQIRQTPQFQINGEFSDALFRNYLAQLGYTSSTFLDAYADDVVSSQLRLGLQTSGFATDEVLAQNIAIAQERRSYQTLLLPVDEVIGSVEIDAESVQTYYEENIDVFLMPERISVDYVMLGVEDFESDVSVEDAEVRQRFELLQAATPTRREAAHILIEQKSDDSHIAILDELQGKIEAGADFGELAEMYSEDIGSSNSGGFLGYTDGTSFPDSFELALAGLEVGEVSDPVMTDSGFHIIKLVDIDREELDFSEQSSVLESEIRREKAGELYRQNLERFRDASFSTDDLGQLVSEFSDVKSLSASSTPLFSRDSGDGIAANADLRAVAFGEIVLEDQLNSEVVELDDSRAVVIHLGQRVEPGPSPLNDVSEQIESQLMLEQGTLILATQAETLVERAKAGEEFEDIAEEQDIQWAVQLDALRGSGNLAENAVFSEPLTQGLPIIGSSVTPSGDYVVYSVDEARSGSSDDYNQDQLVQLSLQLSQMVVAGEMLAYKDTLKDNAKIDIKSDIEF